VFCFFDDLMMAHGAVVVAAAVVHASVLDDDKYLIGVVIRRSAMADMLALFIMSRAKLACLALEGCRHFYHVIIYQQYRP
jgi:hypothetical protein